MFPGNFTNHKLFCLPSYSTLHKNHNINAQDGWPVTSINCQMHYSLSQVVDLLLLDLFKETAKDELKDYGSPLWKQEQLCK